MGAKHRKKTWSKAGRKEVTGVKRNIGNHVSTEKLCHFLPALHHCQLHWGKHAFTQQAQTAGIGSMRGIGRKQNMQTNTGLRDICKVWERGKE